MCGIAGAVNESCLPLINKQRHRGPDGHGFTEQKLAAGGWVSFGHTRLSVIGVGEIGRQPMRTGRYSLTYNGEIYNYGRSFHNDAAWLLHTIDKDGLPAALSQSTGMFAFGLHDNIEGKIHLVVDRMGEKPLYYYQKDDVFAFASSPAALLHLQDKWKINEAALQSFFKLGGVMVDSVWEGIKRVNASELVTYDISRKKITTQRWWRPEYQENTDGIGDLILEAINNVKVADVPVYIFLSGGVDSTLVASQFKGGHAIHMDGPEYGFAKKAADHFGIRLHTVHPKKFDAEEVLKDYVTKTGEPTMAGMIPWITSQAASKLCKVAVSANGADELFFGYDRTTDKVSDEQLEHIFRDIPGEYTVLPIDGRLSSGRWLELMTYVQHDLNRTLDFASMCHGLEVRSPFLNHRLVEMALSIPQERMGRKDILKGMLKRMGFSDQFLNRPKLGFSLYAKPNGLQDKQRSALQWCCAKGFLKMGENMSKRDIAYLEASALGMKVWWEVFNSKIA